MKKEYVKPETAVENVMVETMFAASDVIQEPDGGELGSNERRGGWGDLWN